MDSYKLLEVIVEHGFEINEYEQHYSIRSYDVVDVIVTIPKTTYIAKTVIEYIKELLNI